MSTPKQIARGLLRENRKNERSWRDLSKQYGVKPGTLCRFAKSRGAWLPKDRGIQARLGVLKVRKPRQKSFTMQMIERMTSDTRSAAFGWKDKTR